MAPPFVKKAGIFNFLDKRVDFGKNFSGQPILGSHKTWRGVIFGIIFGILAVGLQYWLYQFSFIREISFLNYKEINILAFGALMSFGAVFGDLFFAFIKRRLKIEPGQRFLPFDQTNYVIGAAIFLAPFLGFDILIWTTIFVFTFFLHIIINRIGYIWNLHQAEW